MIDFLSLILNIFTSTGFYTAALRMTTPLLLAAMGSIFCERAGIMNIALEGWMLIGAMTAVVATYFTGNPWLGALAAILVGIVTALIFAVFTIDIGTDQIVTAVAMNILALGATSLIFRRIFGAMSAPPEIVGLPTWNIPWLSSIPFIGEVFFKQSPLVYLAFLLVPITNFIMFHTTFGLKVRAIGESPVAAETVGINPFRIRYITLLLAGALAGLSGAFLSIGQMTLFQEGMTAGRGFIAYTAVVFGRWMPVGTMFGTLIFGIADALQLRLQAIGMGIPYQFSLMIPYLLTIAALVLAVKRTAWPAAYGVSFSRLNKSK